MVQYKVIQRILGILMMLFSLTMLPPIVVGQLMGDPDILPFWHGFLLILWIGFLLWLPVRKSKEDLRIREGFLIVVLFWVVLGLSGAVPFILSKHVDVSVTDAVFESLSGLTTTGATVLTGLDALPRSLAFYRQELQWLGGMGLIVLAVAILPMLGVGGMQLYRAEMPGPLKDSNKLAPRITETAKLLWYIYLALTIICALAFRLAGMHWFDAVGHSFSTIAIGGFSTHDSSIGFYDNPLIEIVAVVFMLIAGVNFSLHFIAWRTQGLHAYLQDSEFRTYIVILTLLSLISVSYLLVKQIHTDSVDAIRHGVFQVVSLATTTGFTTTDYSIWPGFLPVLLLFASFIGGCAGSTAGGIKVVRFLLLFRQGLREVNRLIHPSARMTIKINRLPLPENVVEAIWGFFALYVAVFVIFMLFLLAMGYDQVTAFSAVAATLNNLGPGLGEVAASFATMDDISKWALCLAMLMGRLELFTMLVIFMPAFWRR